MVITRSCHAANLSSKISGIYSRILAGCFIANRQVHFVSGRQTEENETFRKSYKGKETVNSFWINRKKDFVVTVDFCITGEPGRPGTNKPFPGPPGSKGAKGAVGSTGAQGPQGAKGEKGKDGTGKSGVKYVRWGKTTCPSGAQIVYKGNAFPLLPCN